MNCQDSSKASAVRPAGLKKICLGWFAATVLFSLSCQNASSTKSTSSQQIPAIVASDWLIPQTGRGPKSSNKDAWNPSEPHKIQIAHNNVDTNEFIRKIDRVERACSTLEIEYRFDCVGQGFIWASENFRQNSHYDAARDVLRESGNRLIRLVRENRDAGRPVAGVRKGHGWARRRTFSAVQKSNLSVVVARADRIIQEGATQLLRSGESSKRRRVHYSRMAKVFGSKKRIFRS